MAEFVRAVDLTGYTIMKQDRGGSIGFSLAQQAPEKVSGVIIGNTWAWLLEGFGQKMCSRIMGEPIGRLLAWRRSNSARIALQRICSHAYSATPRPFCRPCPTTCPR